LRNAVLTVLVLALVAATVGAFVITERLKLERSPVTAPRFTRLFSPTCECPTDRARLTIRFRTEDTVDAEIVNRDDDPVRTLAADEPVARGDVTFVWDGRDTAGAVVPDGRYRLRLHLEDSRRTILVPTDFRVDTKPPRLGVISVSQRTISPNGDGRNDRVRIVYRAGQKARPNLTANEAVVVRGRARPAGRARIEWSGRIDGEPAPAGEYRLVLRVRDVAGNLSRPADAGIVRVRYLELETGAYLTEPGKLLRFRVVTDALPFTWSLTGPGSQVVKSGSSDTNAVAVRIPKDVVPGTYRLEATAGGVTDAAAVTIVPRGR
jgi:hypothetical protein